MLIYLGHWSAWVSFTFALFLIRGKGTYNLFQWMFMSALMAAFSTLAQRCLF